MAIVNHFYNATTRKYIALFGTIFNKLSIIRSDIDTGNEVQRLIVPISYGPYQKFLARITQDPGLDRKPAITLPRMAFEITGMQYDGARKLNSVKRIKSSNTYEHTHNTDYQYVPAPYNIEFSLYIMTKYAEDGTQIMEQILPFFKPEWTTTVSLIDGIEPLDIPLVLNSVSSEDIYESDFETRRSLLWTLTFTMKGWFFGPNRQKKVIKFVDTRLFTDMPGVATVPEEQVTSQPGLTANGQPTSILSESVPYENISFEYDWGVITIINDEVIEP